ALDRQQKLDDAADAYRQAIALRANYPAAYNNLGVILREQKKLDEAVAAYQKALGPKGDYAEAYVNLGVALRGQGKLDEAVAAYRKALALKPAFAGAYVNLGSALRGQGRLEEAVAVYRSALAHKPDYAEAYNNLGSALYFLKRWDEAEAAVRRAQALKPEYGDAYFVLGNILRARQKLAAAADAYREAARLKPKEPVIRQELERTERWVELEKQLPALLDGRERSQDPQALLDLADLCGRGKRLYRAAVRFAQDAFAADPNLAEDLPGRHRYHAARAAVLAASGEGDDSAGLDEPERSRLRQQALRWLQADLSRRG